MVKTIDVLPAITINVDVPAKEFQEKMSALAIEAGAYELGSLSDGMSMDIVNFIPKENLGHDDLHGQLIYDYEKAGRIRVEVRARAWNSEDVTAEVYVHAAHHVFDGLIKRCNATYGKRYRMTAAKEVPHSRTSKASEALNDFVFVANKTALHPLDWRRLYRFVRICHATRAHPSKGLIWGTLCKEGFDNAKAEYIADIAAHLLDFMEYE